MVEIKYKKEEDLLHTYENDLHRWERTKKAFETGIDMSPALNLVHLEAILRKFKVDLNGKTVLNLGCGHGTIDCYLMTKFNVNWTGVEFSHKRVERCKKLAEYANVKNKATFINADIHIYLDQLKNKKFDYIFAFEVIEHLIYQKEVIRQIKGSLKKGGRFIGSVPVQPHGGPEQHIQPFLTLQSVRDRLDVEVFSGKEFPLRSGECRLITWLNK